MTCTIDRRSEGVDGETVEARTRAGLTKSGFNALTENRHQFLAYLTRRLGNRADAEDVLQDFCAKAIARQHQLRNADSVVAWLYSLLRSTLLDFYRKRSRRGRLDAAYAAEALPEPQSHEEMTQHRCTCVRGLLPGLHSDQADLIARLDLADEPRDAVADDLKVSSGALAVRLHRARQALKARVIDYCKSCLSDGFRDCSCTPLAVRPDEMPPEGEFSRQS